MTTTPLVLSWNLSPEREGRIRALCAVRRIRLKPVPPEDCGETVGALAGLLPRAGASAPETCFSEELLLLCGFSEPALDAFLRGLRELPTVELKAVLTPSNARWTPFALYQELRREREAFRAQEAPHGP